MDNKMDKVTFGGDVVADVPHGQYTEAEIRKYLESSLPAIAHARCEKVTNDDGTVTFNFFEVAGTKG